MEYGTLQMGKVVYVMMCLGILVCRLVGSSLYSRIMMPSAAGMVSIWHCLRHSWFHLLCSLSLVSL